MNKKIDLHTHTRASDGLKTPDELVNYAIQQEVSVLAITDHDTIGGIDQALEASRGEDILCIPGIEFSIARDRGLFHLVGLNIDHTNSELRSRIDELARLRGTRANRMVDDLNKNGIAIDMNEVIDEAGGGVIGKPHVARVLVRHGYAPDFSSVFKLYLEKGLPGYAPKEKIPLEQAMQLIIKSGGLPVLAHPVSLELGGPEAYGEFIIQLKEIGLRGIEVYADMHSDDDVLFFEKLARRHELLITGGSDYHGDKDEKIGYYGNRLIPYSIYKTLKEYVQ